MTARPIEDVYELTPLQQGILYHCLASDDPSAYAVTLAVTLEGELDSAAFREAFQLVVRRHAALRTSLHWHGLDKPVQVVHGEVEPPLTEHDARGWPDSEREARLESLLLAQHARRLPLDAPPLFRLGLARTGERRHRLAWTFHHAVLEGWSAALVLQDVLAAHAALLRGETPRLPERVPFRELILRQQAEDRGPAEAFWREALRGLAPPTPLVLAPDEGPTRAAETVRLALEAEATSALGELARRHRVTLATVARAAWALVLGRYADSDDVVFGNVVSGRAIDLPGVEAMVGLLVNTLPARVRLPAGERVATWLGQVQQALAAAQRFEHAPLVDVQGWSPVPRGTPLFETLFAFENWASGALGPAHESALRIVSPRLVEGPVGYALAVTVSPGASLGITLRHDPARVGAAAAQRLAEHLRDVLAALSRGFDVRVADVPLLSAGERRQLVSEWNATRRPYARDEGLAELFEEVARRRPDAVAVEDVRGALRYAELDERTNHVARALRRRGVGSESRVGLLAERSTQMVVGMLGIVKAGGAYVPLDPSYPAERLRLMAEDAGVGVVLTQRGLADRAPAGTATVLLEDVSGEPEGVEPAAAAGPESLAYVIYTSGSTGRPKGVGVSHRAVARLVLGSDYVQLGEADVVAQASNASFDAATFEVWGALLNGARLTVLERETLLSPAALSEALERRGVTVLFLTTALFNQVARERPQAFARLGTLLFGGEAVDPSRVRDVLERGRPERLLHVYGPTENTTFSTWQLVEHVEPDARTVPIGRPIANSTAYVLDARTEPVPVGVAGELYVGGEGLARGYEKRADLTAERFVPSPFGTGERLYRTGDRVRRRASGAIEFLGRRDQQVKLRGFRVELEEIERALLADPAVRECVVLVREARPGDKRLVAYLVPRSAEAADGSSGAARVVVAAARERLAASLPDYMVPQGWAVLERLPVNANGKLDREALAAAAATKPAIPVAEPVLPRGPVEEAVAEVWADVLQAPRISVSDDFFELGGHSLLATQVVSRLRELFRVELPLRELFEEPTVAGLARRIESLRREDDASTAAIPEGTGEPDAPLSFAQQRLWFLDQLGAGAAYNIPLSLRLEGPLDAEALAESLAAVVARHETLRTTFPVVGGRPVQRVAPRLAVPLERVDLEGYPAAGREDEARRLAGEETLRPFDLARGPLLRAKLVRLGADDHVLLLTLHHAVADGWSMGVLVRELCAHYRAFRERGQAPLPPLPIQYADFARWQRAWLEGEARERDLAYWKRRLAGELPRTSLPLDHPRPSRPTYRAGVEPRLLPAELSARLRSFARDEGASLYMVLLAAFQALLGRYTGQDDVIVGSPIANRTRREVEGLVGFFVNSLVMRADLSGDPSLRELVARVKQTALEAYDHQHLPFEQLVEEIQPERDLTQNPVFQVVFAVQNAPREAPELPGLSLRPFERGAATIRYDLEVHVFEEGGRLGVLFGYAAELFAVERMRAFARHYETLLTAALEAPEASLAQISLVDEEERRALARQARGADAGPRSGRLSVHARFEAQADRTPDAAAVVCGGERLTYRELDARANRLARRLRAAGVGRESVVAVCLERSVDLVAAELAVLKAGGAYLPIDPDYPAERVAYMVSDGRAATLVTRDAWRGRMPATGVGVVAVDDATEAADAPAARLATDSAPDDLAYVIYTSGSTGRPKGVEVPHAGLANLVDWHLRRYGIGPGDRATLVASPAFDASVWELWPYLAAGACLHVPDEATRAEPARLVRWLADERISHAFLPTPLAEAVLAESLPEDLALRVLLTGGDRLHRPPRKALPFVLVNHYGPTESSVVTTAGDVDPAAEAEPSIGRPIDGLDAWILDRSLRQVPAGVEGELYVGGRGLARGYRGRADLTAECFVPSPFDAGERLYRTGDRVRLRADGGVEFLGRMDEQVKVRGFRIEPGEVEAALLSHPSVSEAAVLLRRGRSSVDDRLVAFVVAAERTLMPAEEDARRASRVEQWQNVYDSVVYDHLDAKAGAQPTFNLAGWDSSYTGQPIAPDEMLEQVEQAVARIGAGSPRRVLEIGCGTGLLLFRTAPRCERYLATDFSRPALDYVRRQLDAAPVRLPVELQQRRADDFTGLAPGSFDAVVLNSVVQYFPSISHLLAVLEGALRLLAPGGRLFVGDVRHLPLLPVFAASVERYQAARSLSRAVLRERAREHAAQEQELLVDPAFFVALARRLPGVGHVEVLPKSGRGRNELVRYRYDAVLHVGPAPRRFRPPRWSDWDELGLDLAALRDRLRAERPEALGLLGIPNARVQGDVEDASALFRDEPAASAGGAVRAIDPEGLRELAAELGYQLELSWASASPEGRLDALFTRPGAGGAAAFPALETQPRPWAEYGNDPLRGTRVRGLVSELRSHLRERLPDHMVPAGFVALESLPLTPNGKIDRRALLAREAPQRASSSAAPRDAVEAAVARLWAQALGLPRVGIDESFFELGGHSLLATRLVAQVRSVLRVDIPVRAVFEAPTVAAFAERVQAARGEPGRATAPAIERSARGDRMPLSYSQERLWLLDQMQPGNPAYNMPAAVRLRGELDVAALERTLSELVRRHESLRTSFGAVDGVPSQLVAEPCDVALERVDVSSLPAGEREDAARAALHAVAHAPFDLSLGPLFRATLARLGERDHALLLVAHHVVSDGASHELLLREAAQLYGAFRRGQPSPLPEPTVQYADYARWQRQWLSGEALERQLAYWRRRLAGLPVCELPAARPRPRTGSHRGAFETLVLPRALVASLQALAQESQASLFMALLAALDVVLARHVGQDDVVVGTPVANRSRAELASVVGFFVNNLVMRADVSGDPSFAELLARVRREALDAYEHQDVPFERLVEELQPSRDPGRTPLFQVFFNLVEAGGQRFELAGLEATPFVFDLDTAKFDLTLYALERGSDLLLSANYARDLFDAVDMRRLLRHLEQVLDQVAADPHRRLSTLRFEDPPVVSIRTQGVPEELADPAAGASLESRFERVAARHAARTAVDDGTRRLRYDELLREARRVAALLSARLGTGEGRVALLFDHDVDMVVAMLGTLLAGKTYVPLDPSHPRARLEAILRDAEPEALLAAPSRVAEAGRLVPELPVLDASRSEAAGAESRAVAGTTAAYLLYTSGSSGAPKGVLQSRANLLGHVRNYAGAVSVRAEDRLSLLAPYTFDASVVDVFAALLSGAALQLRDMREQGAEGLWEWLEASGVTVYHSTPTVFRALVAGRAGRLSGVRRVVLGGEPVEPADVERFRQMFADDCILFNGLGSTESTFHTMHRVGAEDGAGGAPIPVGLPLEGVEVLLLDAYGRPAPVRGEIAVRSRYLTPGYWRLPATTADAFRPDPGSAGGRLYLTGDVGRRRADGTLVFEGRRDLRLKLRGILVEPAEVEAALRRHPAVAEAAVVAQAGAEGPRLVAYVVARNGGAPEPAELRGFLRGLLPEAMIPAQYVTLAALPLTPSRKLDRRALPSPPLPGASASRQPAPGLEQELAAMWAEVLGLERVGAEEDFFALGGQSLKATQVVARLRRRLGIELPLRALFENSTVAAQAAAIAASTAARPVPPQEPGPVRVPRDGRRARVASRDGAVVRLERDDA